MIVSLPFFTLVVGIFAGIFAARSVFRDKPTVTLETVHEERGSLTSIGLAGLFVLMVPLGAQVSDRVCQLFPLWIQRDAATFTWTLLTFAFGSLGSFAICLAALTSHSKRRRLSVALCLFVTAMVTAHWQLNSSIVDALGPRETSDGIVLQSTGSSCAAASVANIVRMVAGENCTEEKAAGLL